MRPGVVLYIIKHLNLNTLRFNFRYFPFRVALRFPVFLSSHVVLKQMKGKLILPGRSFPGIIKIGFGDVGIFDKRYSRSIWEVNGVISFNGAASLGHGSKISVGKNGQLSIGADFNITAESSIVCFHKISFGDNCLLSWQIMMMDTDFHKIYEGDNIVNGDAPISVGNNVWIGARSTILKGTTIPDGCVVAANSLVTKSFSETNTIIGGSPASVLKKDIKWTL